MKQSSKFCKTCDKQVLATRKGVNHILHLILSICSFGWWIIIWVLLIIRDLIVPGDWRCQQCGRGVGLLGDPALDLKQEWSGLVGDISDRFKSSSDTEETDDDEQERYIGTPSEQKERQFPKIHRNSFSTGDVSLCPYVHPNISHEEWDKIADAKDRKKW